MLKKLKEYVAQFMQFKKEPSSFEKHAELSEFHNKTIYRVNQTAKARILDQAARILRSAESA